MALVRFVNSNKSPFAVEVKKGVTILNAAFSSFIEINHNCGGVCACVSCRVNILKGREFLNKKSFLEKKQLESGGFFDEKTRLACTAIVMSNSKKNEIIVEVPPQEEIGNLTINEFREFLLK